MTDDEYKKTELYLIGKAYTELGYFLMSPDTPIAELVNAAIEAGIDLQFRFVPKDVKDEQ